MVETESASLVNQYFSSDYRAARQRFLESAVKCPNFSFHEELKLDAKGPDGKDLFIDIVWLGPVDADKILIHLSATHGVEGHVGAAGQQSLVEDPIALQENTACVMVFGVNSFGYIWNRRVNENNIDVNRNLREDRESPKLYERIDSFMNPKKLMTIDEFQMQFGDATKEHGRVPIISALADGQYDFPEGMFYGGKDIGQGPQFIMSWFEKQFANRANGKDLRFLIVDVHTGLGNERGLDTLLTPITPSDAVVDFFGPAMQSAKQKKTVSEYKPLGLLTVALADKIEAVTECTLPIFRIGQEFGTVPRNQVMIGLWAENMHWHLAIRADKTPDHESEASLQLKKIFSLDDKVSQDKAIIRMRDLYKTSIDYLQVAHTLV